MKFFEAFMDEIEKIAFESQNYEDRGGKVFSVFHGNRPGMGMARAQGLKPRQTPGEQHWSAEKMVTDPSEIDEARKIMKRYQ